MYSWRKYITYLFFSFIVIVHISLPSKAKKDKKMYLAALKMRVDNHIRSRSTGSDSYLGADWTQIQVLTFTELSYEMYIYKNSRQATKDLTCLSFFSKDPAGKQACLTGRLWQSGADGTQIGYKFLFMACWFRTVQLSLPFGEWLSWTTWVFLMASGQLWEGSHNPLHLQVRSSYI